MAQTTLRIEFERTVAGVRGAAVGHADLEEAFADGITTGHPEMPRFQFEPDQIDDLIAFFKSLE